MIKWYPYFFFVLTIIVLFLYLHEQKKFHAWIKTYWGKVPTISRKARLLTYIVGLLFLIGSLADWRGDEVITEGKVSSEKMILLIDNSLSMLAEDVRPNRYEKALLMARHLLKATPGQEIAVMLFSDVTKKYVPFTTDIDLIDARLSGLKDQYRNVGGTSNTKQAIREALDYLDPNPMSRRGNIVIFTDADAMDEDFPLEVGAQVSVAVIAIGTVTGSNIPLRGSDGVLRGYKTFQGQQVTTTLNQKFLDSLGKNIKNYKYWVVSSFSLPTNEIQDFFRQKYLNSEGNEQRMRSREVLYEWWVVPGILLLICSLLFKRLRSWTMLLCVWMYMDFSNQFQSAHAQENKVKDIVPLLDAYKKNQLDTEGKLSVAQKILEAGDAKKATMIYKETLEDQKIDDKNKQDWINYAQALSANKQNDVAIKKMMQLQEYLDKHETSGEFKKIFSENLLSLMQSLEQQQKQEKQEKEEKEKEEKEKDKQEKQQEKNGQGKPGENKDEGDDNKNQEGSKDNKDKNGDQEKNNDKQEDKQQNQKSRAERQKELSPILKQLLNEDRNLQQKLMDTSTKGGKEQEVKQSEKKDW